MVTAKQARQQLTQQQQILSQAKAQITQTSLPAISVAQLRTRGRTQILQRRSRERQLAGAKERELTKLKPAEQELQRAEKEVVRFEAAIKEQGRQRAAFDKALKVFFDKDPRAIFFLNKLEKKFFQQIQAGRESAVKKSIDEAIAKLKAKGIKDIKPIFEKGKGVPVGFEGIITPTPKPGVIVPALIPRPTVIGLPPPIPKVPFKPPLIGKIKQRVKEALAKLPRDPRGLVGFLNLDKDTSIKFPFDPAKSQFTFDVEPFIKTGGGTAKFTIREKTFFEKFKINPNDASAIKLKADSDRIQSSFQFGQINETQANLRLEKASDEFTKAQIKKGIPKNVALGVGFALIQATPVGPFADAALVGDLFLKRNIITKQFKKFPKESIGSTAAFIAGNLIGRRFVAGARLKIGETPEINTKTLQSISELTGKQRTKLTQIASEFDPEFSTLVKTAKLTDTIAYTVKTVDGRTFRVLEFSRLDKLTPDGLRGVRDFIGFEVGKPKPGEVLVGKGFEQLKGIKGESFIRIFKFQPASTKLGRLVQRSFGGGKIFDILQKSQIVKRGKGGVTIETQAGLLKVSSARANLIRKANKLVKELDVGKKVPINQLRSIINIERRLRQKKPFTAKEFEDAGFKTLTTTQIKSLLNQIRLTKLTADVGVLDVFAEKALVGVRETVFGKAVTFGLLPKPLKPKAPITPFKVTFPKPKRTVAAFEKLKDRAGKFRVPKLIQADQAKVGKKPFTKSGVDLPLLVGGTGLRKLPPPRPSPPVEIFLRAPGAIPAIGLAVARTRSFPITRTTVPFLKSATALTLSLASKSTLVTLLRSRIKTLQGLRSGIQEVGAISSFDRVRQQNLTRTIQGLQLQLRSVQKLKLRRPTKLADLGKLKVTPVGKIKIPKPPIPTEKFAKKKKVKKVFVPSKVGYNVKVKSKGVFRKVNVNPITKKKAQSLGAFLTDKSTARSFRISRSGTKAKKPFLRVPPNYFTKNLRKFRGPKIKGKFQPIKKLAIERSKFAIDSRGEKRQLSVARLRARLFKTAKKRRRKKK